jgi:hypothetical protein
MRKGCLLRKLVWLRSVEGMLELGRERRIKEDGDSWRERERERHCLVIKPLPQLKKRKRYLVCLSNVSFLSFAFIIFL